MSSLVRVSALCLILVSVMTGTASAARLKCQDPIIINDGQNLKAIYFFGHWWDPWKGDDNAIANDLKKIRELGFNTIGVDHEVSQAVDKDWYWLDREYRIAGQEKLYVLPWLQLQSGDRENLMRFSHRQIKPAVNQDKQVEESYVRLQDPEFQRALAHYITVYLDRYGSDPALLKVRGRGGLRPVVGLTVETGWRNGQGLPLSFDEESNAYFRKWMRSSYHDLDDLNRAWGTSYKSFDEIDPCDKKVFNYGFEDKANMPAAVRDHVQFRARVINSSLQAVADEVHKKHKNVILLAEIAYPLSVDNPDANVYRWNNANTYKAIGFADMVLIRTVGNMSTNEVRREQELMMLSGKPVILAYRIFGDATPERAVGFAVDCATSASGMAYYNWNEVADNSSAIYDKPNRQSLARLMTFTYDTLYATDKRFTAPSATEPETPPIEKKPSDSPASADELDPPAEPAPAPAAQPKPSPPAEPPPSPDENGAPAAEGTLPPAPVPGAPEPSRQ